MGLIGYVFHRFRKFERKERWYLQILKKESPKENYIYFVIQAVISLGFILTLISDLNNFNAVYGEPIQFLFFKSIFWESTFTTGNPYFSHTFGFLLGILFSSLNIIDRGEIMMKKTNNENNNTKVDLLIHRYVRHNQKRTREFDEDFSSFWNKQIEKYAEFTVRIGNRIDEKGFNQEDSLLFLQSQELFFDVIFLQYTFTSGLYSHGLQRLRYTLESWAYSYYVDLMRPENTFQYKWNELENISTNYWRGFLQNMPENNGLRENSTQLLNKLHKFVHADYKRMRSLITSLPIGAREFSAKKSMWIFNEVSYKQAISILEELVFVLELFVGNFEREILPVKIKA